MPHNSRRHRLLLYSCMLNRWWKYTLGIGVIVLALATGLAILPMRLPQYHFLWVSDTNLLVITGAGLYALMLTFFLLGIRNLAYVQPFATHLRLVTPFLRLDISYRRILKASTVEMQHLFPFGKYKDWRQGLLRLLASDTAIVLDLKGWPLPRWALEMFLSPFFFPDKTARLALLVPNWMDFSTDMDSFRSTWLDSLRRSDNTPQSDLLASLSRSIR
jgi:hypothetical protein